MKQNEAELLTLVQEFQEYNDRSVAIVAAAVMDVLLGKLLLARFTVKGKTATELLEDKNGPLSTLSSRISLTYCLGLIGADAYHDLNLIRKIRNDFAHDMAGANFNSARIQSMCANLTAADIGGKTADPRARFQKSALRLIASLIAMINGG